MDVERITRNKKFIAYFAAAVLVVIGLVCLIVFLSGGEDKILDANGKPCDFKKPCYFGINRTCYTDLNKNATCVGNLTCIGFAKGKCQCPPFHLYVNKTCQNWAPVSWNGTCNTKGSSYCAENMICVGKNKTDGSNSTLGTCKCKKGYFYNIDDGRCSLPGVLGFNASCDPKNDTFHKCDTAAKLVCHNETLTCHCSQDQVFDARRRCSNRLNATCIDDEDCVVYAGCQKPANATNTETVFGKCACHSAPNGPIDTNTCPDPFAKKNLTESAAGATGNSTVAAAVAKNGTENTVG